jgi:transcriptional regulator with XRE-family HTH domain
MNYGKAIRITRALADVSQRELAESLDTDPSYISLLEMNKREPSRELLERIATELKVPMHLLVLMAAEGEESGNSEGARLAAIGEALAKLLFAENANERKFSTPSRAAKPGKSTKTRTKTPDKPRATQRDRKRRKAVL